MNPLEQRTKNAVIYFFYSKQKHTGIYNRYQRNIDELDALKSTHTLSSRLILQEMIKGSNTYELKA